MEQIVKLFKSNNIQYIVSVDDCYRESFTDINETLLLDDMVSNLMSYQKKIEDIQKELNITVLSKLPPHIREEELSKFLTELTSEEKQILIKGKKELDDTLLKSQKENLLFFLQNLERIEAIKEFKVFGTVEEAKHFLTNGVKIDWEPNEEKKVLWLIDREFGEKSNEGFSLLGEFSSEENMWNIGVLATQNVSDISSEEKFNSYLEKVSSHLGENKNSVWIIEKRLIDPAMGNEFAEKILHGLRRNYTYKITNFLTDTLSKGIKGASIEFKNIEQSTINNIILKFSNQEGTSIIETLIRVLLAISKHDLNEKITSKYDEISKLIVKYEELCEEEDFVQRSNLEEVYQFRHKEKYNTSVNSHYYPVGFGDIFKINRQEYILISQPCDIQIRGENGERNLQQATLLKLTRKLPDHKAYFILNYYNRTETYYVLFRESLLIDFNILDLCSLNNDGKATVKESRLGQPLEFSHRYNFGQRNRLEKVLSELNTVYNQKKDILKTFEQIHEQISLSDLVDKEKIISYMNDYQERNNSYWNSIISINNFNLVDGEISFPVQRKCRLNEIFATNIMLEYSTHSSRVGLPGDYASNFIHTEYNVLVKDPLSYLGEGSNLISTGQKLIVLKDDRTNDILDNAFVEFIAGNVSEESEIAIEKNPASYISINKREKQVIIPGDYLISSGKELVSFSKGTLIVSSKLLEANTPQFYDLINKLAIDKEVIKKNNLYIFFKGNKLKEIIKFRLNNFVDNIFEVEIEQKLVLSIKLNIIEKEDNSYDVDIQLIEHKKNIDKTNEKLALKS